MKKGRLVLGLHWTSTFLHAEHGVEQEQFEPGIPAAEQAHLHALDFVLMDWNVVALYGISDRIGVELDVPIRMNWIRADFEDESGTRLPAFSSIHHRNETLVGIGDVAIGARFGLLRRARSHGWSLELRAGVALPTGNTEEDPFALGRQGQAHQHIFFGSGTFIPLVGFEASYAFTQLSLAAWSVAQPSLYENSKGYKASTRFAGGVGVQTRFGLTRWRFLLSPEVFVETPATWGDDHARNSGRTDLIISGGVSFAPTPSWQLHLLLKVPYYRHLAGGQLKAPLLGVVGAEYAFDVFDSGESQHVHP